METKHLKKTSCYLDEQLYKQFKVVCIQNDIKLSDAMNMLLEQFIKDFGVKKQIGYDIMSPYIVDYILLSLFATTLLYIVVVIKDDVKQTTREKLGELEVCYLIQVKQL